MKVSNIQQYVSYFYSSFKKEKYPKHFSGLNFRYDAIIQYLTSRCNSQCITCDLWKAPQSAEDKEVWTIENLKKLYSTTKVEKVYLTGGEPTMLANFKELVREIYRSSGAFVSFTTNALALEKIKKDLLWLKAEKVPFLISISCNGFEDIHDFSRGVKGNYKKILELMNFLEREDMPFYLLYTIFPFNISETAKLVKYWRNKGINVGISIARADERLIIDGKNKKYVLFNMEDIRKAKEVLLELSKIFPEYFTQYYLIKRLSEGRKYFPCFGLYKRLTIGPYGNVYPCDGLPRSLYIGNLKDSSFDFSSFVMSNRETIQRVFYLIRDKKCQPCGYMCDLMDGISRSMSRINKFKILIRQVSRKLNTLYQR